MIPNVTAARPKPLGPTYTVVRLAGHRWALRTPHGDTLATYGSRQAAVTVGRALAGWRGTVNCIRGA